MNQLGHAEAENSVQWSLPIRPDDLTASSLSNLPHESLSEPSITTTDDVDHSSQSNNVPSDNTVVSVINNQPSSVNESLTQKPSDLSENLPIGSESMSIATSEMTSTTTPTSFASIVGTRLAVERSRKALRNILDASSKALDEGAEEKPSFPIWLEGEEEDGEGEMENPDHLLYLPLNVGSSGILPTDICQSFKTPNNILIGGIGENISQEQDELGDTETSQSPPPTSSDRLVDSGTYDAPSTSSSSPPLTYTIKSGMGSDSIAKQFNEIAKLTKGSVRSRRLIRTTVTKVLPPGDQTDVVNESTNQHSPSGDDDEQRTRESADSLNRTESSASAPPFHLSRTGGAVGNKVTDSVGGNVQMNTIHKPPFHSRFHSDEARPIPDFLTLTSSIPKSSELIKQSRRCGVGKQMSGGGQPHFHQQQHSLDSSSTQSSSSPRVPTTYTRSTTSELLPKIARFVPVLRSRSAASTIPSYRQSHDGTYPQDLNEPSDEAGDSVDGSSSSLPSIDAGRNSAIDSVVSIGEPATSVASRLDDFGHLQHHHDCELDRVSVGGDGSLTGQPNQVVPTKRRMVVRELIDVEKEYVKVLSILVQVYLIPLRREKILDDQTLDTIFFKMNELLELHMSFRNSLPTWEATNTVGDKLLDMFSSESLTASYCSYVENFPKAEKALELAIGTKSSFQRFCEQKLRSSRSKLPLKALLVQPIQRIPRYELLIKRLIESTPSTLADKTLLVEASTAIHKLAVRIDKVHAVGQEESLVDGIKLIERLLAPATLTPSRLYIRHDIVLAEERKEPVYLFTFTDQIVFTTAKRRTVPSGKKPIFLQLQSLRGKDTIENIKYKIFDRLALEAIEFEPRIASSPNEISIQPREARDKRDLMLQAEIDVLSTRLDDRPESEVVVRRLYQTALQELEGLRSAKLAPTDSGHRSVLTQTTKEGIERYELLFPSVEKRKQWESTVIELKRQLSSVKRTARFCHAMKLPKTVSGVQLSTASVMERVPGREMPGPYIWVGASDGFTGYVAVVGGYGCDPSKAQTDSLPGCNSKITHICAVPDWPGKRKLSNGSSRRSSKAKGCSDKCTIHSPVESNVGGRQSSSPKRPTQRSTEPIIPSSSLSSSNPDKAVMRSQSDSAKPSSHTPVIITTFTGADADQAKSSGRVSTSTDSSDVSEPDDEMVGLDGRRIEILVDPDVGDDSRNFTTISSSSANKSNKHAITDPSRPTMWLGTEDGSLFVYYADENVKNARSREVVPLPAAINTILHLDIHVFVACNNGDLLVYRRCPDGLWDLVNPITVRLQPEIDEPLVVRRMLAVAGNIWCAVHRFVFVVNSLTLQTELSFAINGNPADPRGIQLMAYGSHTVWLAVENSSRVSLYNATSGEFLMEIDLKPAVLQGLQGCDDVILRHKEACLRLTCLTVCKDILWVGTSAGVILTVAIPRVNSRTTWRNLEQPRLEALKQGHVGRVRFLICYEDYSLTDSSRTRAEKYSHQLEPLVDRPGSDQSLLPARSSGHKRQDSGSLSSTTATATSDVKSLLSNKTTPTLSSLLASQLINRTETNNQSESDQVTTSLSAIQPTLSTKNKQQQSQHHHLTGVRRLSTNPCASISTQLKVISGGDGYEEFAARFETSRSPPPFTGEQIAQQQSTLGDEDSVNFLLTWDVH